MKLLECQQKRKQICAQEQELCGFKRRAAGYTSENCAHSSYLIELGIPKWLAQVEVTLLEGMSSAKSKTLTGDLYGE